MLRRTAMAWLLSSLCTFVLPVSGASSADYPTHPIRFVVGYPAGGSTDIIARLIGQRLSERLGQQLIVENKPGAGNNIGTETVARADPDGYTVLLINPANFINASLYANLNFNFIRDIAPVASFLRVPNVMTVPKDVPAKTVAETVPGYEASALFGMGAPKKTPPEIIAKLNQAINAVLADPEVKKRLVELGGDPLISTPEAFGEMIAAETEKWEKVVKFAGLRID